MEGNKDLLVLTKSEIIEDIHREYFAVGSDTVETNTFETIPSFNVDSAHAARSNKTPPSAIEHRGEGRCY